MRDVSPYLKQKKCKKQSCRFNKSVKTRHFFMNTALYPNSRHGRYMYYGDFSPNYFEYRLWVK
jgi:hypothetical protein